MPAGIAVTPVDRDGEVYLAQAGGDRSREFDLAARHVARVEELGNQRSRSAKEFPHGFVWSQVPQAAVKNARRTAGGTGREVILIDDDDLVALGREQVGNSASIDATSDNGDIVFRAI